MDCNGGPASCDSGENLSQKSLVFSLLEPALALALTLVLGVGWAIDETAVRQRDQDIDISREYRGLIISITTSTRRGRAVPLPLC